MKKIINMLKNAQIWSAVGAFVIGIGVIFVCISIKEKDNTGYVESESMNSLIDESTNIESDSETESTTDELVTEIVEQDTSIQETTEVETQEKKTTKKSTTKKQTTKPTQNPTEFINADISAYINKSGNTIRTRFKTPKGFYRLEYENGSYAEYVRNQPLEPYGTKLYEYDGKLAENQTWFAAIIKTDFHEKGWLQCADCVIKLVSDYLYKNGRKNEIVFDLASGERMAYSKWTGSYKNYMSEVYYAANTLSLMNQKESKKMSLDKIFPGAYLIMAKDKKHEYGHAVYVIDVAKNPKTGELAFLLAQGSTPSQAMNVFLNPLHPNDPWYYSSEIGSTFAIPFWEFKTSNLYYYEPIGIQKTIGMEETVPATEVVSENKTDKETTTNKSTSESKTEPTTTVEETTTTVEETTAKVEETTTTGESTETTESTEGEESTDSGE